MLPRAERKRHLDHAEFSAGGRHDIEQDLEPLHRQRRRKLLEPFAPDHEEPAHRVGDFDMQQLLCDVGRKYAAAKARAPETPGVAATDITAADHEFGLPRLQQREHLWELCFVVLKIGVHHRDVGRAGSQDALDACPGEPSPADPANAPDTGVGLGQLPGHVPSPVRGIVIDEDDLPRDTGQRGVQLREKLGNVVALFESRHHDTQLTCRCCPG